ncbi:hypothetical protein [Chondromyces apiculatus]|nr:hypothetical protein [Chondromyces apiculatus]
MSATWWIYSPLAPQAMRDLEAECERAVEAFLEEHPGCDDEVAEVLAGGELRSLDEVKEGYARYRTKLSAAVAARVEACRSVMTLERPGDLDVDALQVSVLRYLLERTGEALVMFNDYPLVPSEHALENLAEKEGAEGFGATPAAPKPRRARMPATAGAAKVGSAKAGSAKAGAAKAGSAKAATAEVEEDATGEERAARVEHLLSAARDNPELSIDVVEVLRKTPDLGRRYAALLIEEGSQADASAAKSLRAAPEEVASVADKLEAALRAVTG